jgi:phage FluMu gp28-like protein
MLVFEDKNEPVKPTVNPPVEEPIVRTPAPKGTRPPQYRIIVKKDLTPEAMNEWLSTVPGFIEGLTRDMDDHETQLYDYQVEHMLDWAAMRHRDKCRQIGYSWICSAEGLAKCHLKRVQTSAYISYNHEEAMDKIRIARLLYDTMPTEYQKKLVCDNKQSLEFEYKGGRSRMISIAQRQPRGLGHNTDVYLDEVAHMQYARLIYTATVPVITRGSGVLTLGSTPFGKNSLHYEIGTDVENYWMFSHMRIFWWDCPALCNDVATARKLAPTMSTAERLDRFGTDKLFLIFGSMEIEQFQQEYELYYADESASYFPLDLLTRCAFIDASDDEAEFVDPNEFVPAASDLPPDLGFVERPDLITDVYAQQKITWSCSKAKLSGGDLNDQQLYDTAIDFIDRFATLVSASVYGRELVVGIDIGHSDNDSEISVFEEIEVGEFNVLIERMMLGLHNFKYRLQEAVMRHLLRRLHPRKCKIDSTGLGNNLAENLQQEFASVVEAIDFSADNKREMAQAFKMRLEDRTIAILNERDSLKQIHSIRRSVTENAVERYTVVGTKKHHGDKFWSKALAVSCGTPYERQASLLLGVKTAGVRVFQNASEIKRVVESAKLAKTAKLPVINSDRKMFALSSAKVAKAGLNPLFFDSKFYG